MGLTPCVGLRNNENGNTLICENLEELNIIEKREGFSGLIYQQKPSFFLIVAVAAGTTAGQSMLPEEDGATQFGHVIA